MRRRQLTADFEKANEIYFRLGIIYKHQRKYSNSLDCFRLIIKNPPRPLTSWDIWFQLGHVYELDRDFVQARDAYMRVLGHQPDHAKVLQQLGWLYHQPGAPFANHEQAIGYLTKSLETDGNDAQSWYLLGRAFMAGQRYNKAYEAYQQAVYRDGRNPTFWCSIGVLYFQINQYRDALDAYSRAIRLNPYIAEVWFNLGSLYESCNNQITDAIDAYSRALELDPAHTAVKQRLQLLQSAGGSNVQLPPPPAPVDVHPSQYSGAPQSAGYAPNGSQPGSPPPVHPPQGGQDGPGRDQQMPPGSGRELPSLPADYRSHSPATFRGGAAPPPLNHVDESRGSMSRHAPLAPIDIERPPEPPRDMREPGYREGPPGFGGNGGPPVPTRFDPTAEGGRHPAPSPGSPRRRAEQGYGQYPPQGHPQYRDREREEWERRSGNGGDPRMPPHDPRGPSPRPGLHPSDPRGGPPRDPRDPREFARSPDMYPQYGGGPQFERGGPSYQPYPDPRDPRARERFDEYEAKPPVEFGNSRQASMAREMAHADMRAPSPAASTSSKASTRRKVSDRKDDSAKKLKKGPDSKGRRLNGDEASPRPSPAPPSLRQSAAPSRTVDEGKLDYAGVNRADTADYDEGVDALMTLHNERRAPSVATDKAPSPVIGTKRPTPPSPDVHGSKKAKGSPPAIGSPTRQTVIEVLNAPRVPPNVEVLNAPRVTSSSFMKFGRDKERRSPERPPAKQQPSAPTSPRDDVRDRAESERERRREEREDKDEAKEKEAERESERDDRQPTPARSPSAPKSPEKRPEPTSEDKEKDKRSPSVHRSPSAQRSPVSPAADKQKAPSKAPSSKGSATGPAEDKDDKDKDGKDEGDKDKDDKKDDDMEVDKPASVSDDKEKDAEKEKEKDKPAGSKPTSPAADEDVVMDEAER